MFGTKKWSGPWTRCLWEIETNGCEKCIEIISQSLYVLRIYWLCNLSTRQTLHNDFPRRVLIAVVISNFLVADSEWWFLVNFVQHKSDYGIWPLLKQHTGFRCSLPEPKHWFLAFTDFGHCFFPFLYSASVTSTIPLPFEPILILSTCHNLGLFTHLYAFFRSVRQPHIMYGVFSIICLARKSPLVVD